VSIRCFESLAALCPFRLDLKDYLIAGAAIASTWPCHGKSSDFAHIAACVPATVFTLHGDGGGREGELFLATLADIYRD